MNSNKGENQDEALQIQSTPSGKKYIFRLNNVAMVNIDENEVLEVSSDEVCVYWVSYLSKMRLRMTGNTIISATGEER